MILLCSIQILACSIIYTDLQYLNTAIFPVNGYCEKAVFWEQYFEVYRRVRELFVDHITRQYVPIALTTTETCFMIVNMASIHTVWNAVGMAIVSLWKLRCHEFMGEVHKSPIHQCDCESCGCIDDNIPFNRKTCCVGCIERHKEKTSFCTECVRTAEHWNAEEKRSILHRCRITMWCLGHTKRPVL